VSYNIVVRFWRFTAAVAAAFVVFTPAIRSGVDVKHLLQPSASAAAASPGLTPAREGLGSGSDFEADADNLAGADVLAERDRSTRLAAERDLVPARGMGELAPAPVAFGFGALTGFHPSDAPRELVLSFDDGPDLKFTPLVLDELDRRGLKAIFFVTGHRVVGDRPEDLARRELLHKIAAHGHLVGNHTMSHRNLCQQSPTDAAAEIDANAEVIAGATGVRPILFRAPYGARCHSLEVALAARELVSVGWNLDPQDWRNPSSEEILAYLQARLARLDGRGILLLHDTHPASVFALGPLLDWIARENRRAVAEKRPPIVLRDYSVFLPSRSVPPTAILAVLERMTQGLPSLPAPLGPLMPPILARR
jgi:peptidoglycan/xylan/chitin deacetylase (PgdA/CDA1 family)